MFEGQVEYPQHINLLDDDVERYSHVIANLRYAMARRYVCKACNKWCRRDVTHECEQTCSDCMASLPCAFEAFEFPATDILRAARDSRTTSRPPRTKTPFLNAGDIALHVEHS